MRTAIIRRILIKLKIINLNERTKKKLIAFLLLISCIVSGWLLFITPAAQNKQLQSFAETDSLLLQTLADFNIQSNQISRTDVQAGSTFTRKNYHVSVPPAFSKTQFHSALQQELQPYNIGLPARVTFPERNMAIHFYFGNNVIRTVRLVTNDELTMQRSFASLIVAFDERPSDYLLEMLTSMGEPIPLAVMLRPPLALPGWWSDFREEHDQPLYVWPQNNDAENLLTKHESPPAEQLETLEESSPNAVLLHFFQNSQTASSILRGTPFSYIDAGNSFILDGDAGRSAFDQTFRAFVRRAREGRTALGIIIASEESLQWTQEELSTYKKGGLMIQPPKKTSY